MTDTDLSAAARRIVELGSKATAAPWRRVGKTGYINGRDDTASRLDAEVRVADVGAYRDKELLRFSRDRWDVDLDFIAFTRNHAPALAAEYLRQLGEIERLREALESKGLADAYRDGFDAALHTADSFKSYVAWGPKATPTDAYDAGVQHLREALHKSRAALDQHRKEVK